MFRFSVITLFLVSGAYSCILCIVSNQKIQVCKSVYEEREGKMELLVRPKSKRIRDEWCEQKSENMNESEFVERESKRKRHRENWKKKMGETVCC